MSNTTYHRVLRVSALVCALVLVFESGLISKSTTLISLETHSYLANVVGMSASVKPTELSLLTAELAKREKDLAAREAALSEREIEIGLSTDSNSNERTTFILAGILFILLVLIVLNYILDYLRHKESELAQTV